MAGSGRDERAAVRGAQEGSLADLELLFRRHWPSAYRAAYLVVHDAAAAEDIAQEAFLAAVRALDRFDRRRPFAPWLHRIVVNRAIDWARRRQLRAEVGGDALAGEAAPDPPEADPELLESLGGLSPDHRAESPRACTRADSGSCSTSRAEPSTRASAAGSTSSRGGCREGAPQP